MPKAKKHNRYNLLVGDKLDALIRREADARAVEPNDLIRAILSVALTGKEIPLARGRVREMNKLIVTTEHQDRKTVPYIPPSIKKSR